MVMSGSAIAKLCFTALLLALAEAQQCEDGKTWCKIVDSCQEAVACVQFYETGGTIKRALSTPQIRTLDGDLFFDIPDGKSVKIGHQGENHSQVATTDMVAKATSVLNGKLNDLGNLGEELNDLSAKQQTEFEKKDVQIQALASNLVKSEKNAIAQKAEFDGLRNDVKLLTEQYEYLYNYTRSESPTQTPTMAPSTISPTASPVTPSKCSHLPSNSKTGYYNLIVDGKSIKVYCMMDGDNRWNLCAHAGNRVISGGNRHWWGEFGGDVTYVKKAEQATWCGRVKKIDTLRIEVRDRNLKMLGAIEVKWYGKKANEPIEKRNWPINRDVKFVNSDGGGTLTTSTNWDKSNNAFSEHFYLTFADRKKDESNFGNGRTQYYEIGAHRSGRHQHYEECCNGGGGEGDGRVNVGSYKSGCGCTKHTMSQSHHVFFYYK